MLTLLTLPYDLTLALAYLSRGSQAAMRGHAARQKGDTEVARALPLGMSLALQDALIVRKSQR